MEANASTTAQGDKPKRGTVNPQPLHAAQIADALLHMRTAAAISGLSEATLYRKAAADPTFPKLVKMGARCTRIRAGELMTWLAAQGAKAQSTAPASTRQAAPPPPAKAPSQLSAWHQALGQGAPT